MPKPWLRSLSEDWSPSKASVSPESSNTTQQDHRLSSISQPSRIPLYTPNKNSSKEIEPKCQLHKSHAKENISYDSIHAVNSTLEQNNKANEKDGSFYRRLCGSTSSTQHNTIKRRQRRHSANNVSQDNLKFENRSMNRKIGYNIGNDLFTSPGLENIFNKPSSDSDICSKLPTYDIDPRITETVSIPLVNSEINDLSPCNMPQENKSYLIESGTKIENEAHEVGLKNSRSLTLRTKNPGIKFSGQTTKNLLDDMTTSIPKQEKRGLESNFGRNFSSQSDKMNEQLSQIILDHKAPICHPDSMDGQSQKLENNQEVKLNTNSSDFSLFGAATTENSLTQYDKLEQASSSQIAPNQLKLSLNSISNQDESVLLPEGSMQASTPKELAVSTKESACDYLPKQVLCQDSEVPNICSTESIDKEQGKPPRSPLKLFDSCDAFTQRQVNRRLQQFETQLNDNQIGKVDNDLTEVLMPRELDSNTEDENIVSRNDNDHSCKRQSLRSVSGLNFEQPHNFECSRKVSSDSIDKKFLKKRKKRALRPVPGQGLKLITGSPKSVPAPDNNVTTNMNKVNTTKIVTCKQTNYQMKMQPLNCQSLPANETSVSSEPENICTPRRKNGDVEGKRLPKTPLNQPDRKRRRTVPIRELEEGPRIGSKTNLGPNVEVDQQNWSTVYGKQKESKVGNEQNYWNSKGHNTGKAPNLNNNKNSKQDFALTSKNSYTYYASNILDHESTSAHAYNFSDQPPIVPSSNKNYVCQTMLDSSEYSLSTEDFIYKANKVTSDIRSKDRSQNQLSSVEKPDSESNQNYSTPHFISGHPLDDSYQESTQEPFSRPPSREGAALIPRSPQKQSKPELPEHLRKFQESNEFNAFLSYSQNSISVAKKAFEEAKEIDRFTEEKINKASNRRSAMQTKNSNIIYDQKYKNSIYPVAHEPVTGVEADFPSLKSNSSSGISTVCSVPTGSSRESDHRRTIDPKSVSHLIPDKMAGMVLDRDQYRWIKNKTPHNENINFNSVPSEEIEDDPLRDISDLVVDETLERERLQATATNQKKESQQLEINYRPVSQHKYLSHSIPDLETFDKKSCFLFDSPITSQDPSKTTDSPLITMNKTTCYEKYIGKNEKVANKKPAFRSQVSFHRIKNSPSLLKELVETGEQVDKEILLHDHCSRETQTPKKRNTTISFSSPVASFIALREDSDQTSNVHDEGAANPICENSDVDCINENIKIQPEKTHRSFNSTKLIPSWGVSRKVSLSGHKFSARSISRIDERDENNSSGNYENQRNRSLSIFSPEKPAPAQELGNFVATPSLSPGIGALTLSPLSEFTVHQVDESLGLDVSYVAKNERYKHGKTKTLSLSIKELVEKITEVEPFEIHWEHLKEISLKDKCLKSVHKLDNFCERLKKLDISHNQISNLDGVPKTIQELYITNNFLSDMTAWGHLINLQYVDISNNNLESLSSLKCLNHIRFLRADKNKIVSLEGIDQHNSLLSLRLRGNHIKTLNFHNSKLQLLTDLDLRENQICKLENIQQLKALTKLDLIDNKLSEFSTNSTDLWDSIKYLRLSDNNLESIDVGRFPNLRLLYLDRNRLGMITGLLKTKHLDSLSIREQHGSAIHSNVISEAFEVRKFFLSGNFIKRFEPVLDFLNLQYLELANCGLESLPKDFGSMLANVRVLNLNFNALTDIRPLGGIIRLKRLHLAGNRLNGLDGLANLLSQLPTLLSLDFRNNPLTIGFYSPPHITGNAIHQSIDLDDTNIQEPYTLVKINKNKDDLYMSCLDMRTRMKRRIYEMYLIRLTRQLKILDGLPVNRSILFTMDNVYHSMVEAGFITTSHKDGNCLNNLKIKKPVTREELKEVEKDDLWQAEDSFA